MDEFKTPQNINWQGHVGMVNYGDDNVAIFFNKSVPNIVKSRELGRPYNEDKIYVRIAPPGERLNIIERPVRPDDQRRWPMQWQQFLQRQDQTSPGAPVELLYPERPSIAATLRANGVQTIEQCASLSSSAIDNIGMGGQQWVNDAKKFLEVANKGMSAVHVRHELETRDREIGVLKRQINEMAGLIEQLRSSNNAQMNLEQIQTLLAGAMARPVHMPQVAFDSQAAMINATHPTAAVKSDKPRKRAKLTR